MFAPQEEVMSDTSELRQCPKCGGPIPAEAPQGLCPKCLLAQASIPTETVEASTRPVPPALHELAAAFPHLEILELIGQGGMGFVYKARQPKLERLVALKILPQSSTTDSRFAERFTREGRVLARLNHPHIVTIHDFGQASGFFYLLMEYVDGVNLRQAMRAGRFTPEQALAIVPKICDALQFAHNEGILHRDIKPENILLDSKGRVKIADFGIAKLVGEPQADAHLTASGGTLGTPHYMAPEQVEKPATVDHRADIYSLGVVFYEMLTGELPLGKFQPPSQKVHVDVRLDDVVLHALEKEPSRRYQQVSEVKTAVDGITASPGASPPPAFVARAPRPRLGTALKAGLGVFVLTFLVSVLIASNFTRTHLAGALALGVISGLILGGLSAIFAGLFSAWRSLSTLPGSGPKPDIFWRRFAVAVAAFILALVLIPMSFIFLAMLVPAYMKARDTKGRAVQLEKTAREAAMVQQRAANETNAAAEERKLFLGMEAAEQTERAGAQHPGPVAKLFLNPEQFTRSNPEPGQLDWGFKAFVPPDSLATFLFVVWSNGVPAVDPAYSRYFKVGKMGGVDLSCLLSCHRLLESREFSSLDREQQAKSLAGWRYSDPAGVTNAVRWDINFGTGDTGSSLRSMPVYHLAEARLPLSVKSGHQLRFPLIEFDQPADSPSNGWSGVDLQIFLEPLRAPPIRMLPNEIDMTNYVAARGLFWAMEEAQTDQRSAVCH